MTQLQRNLLTCLTAPQAVALIGASSNPAKLTARPVKFLIQHGFKGKILPVNPGSDTVLGLPAYTSVLDIPDPVDHAYILLDADHAIQAMQDCAIKGVRVVSVLADGFAEAGPEGVARQMRIAQIAEDAGILLIGPNSTGVVSTSSGFVCTTNAAFAANTITTGEVAALSQSGSIIGTILSRGQANGHGFSTLVSVGNEARSGVGEIGQILLDDPNTKAFQLFLETIRDADAIEALARGAAQRGKPVVAYVIGLSEEGRALAVSHTGALTGGREAVSAFLREVGIQEVSQFESLIEAPRTLSRVRLPKTRPRTATVISTTGGGGAMVVDQLSALGVKIAGISDTSRATLSAKDIPLGHGKLVDVTLAGARYESMKAVIDTLIRDPEIGLLVVAVGSSAQFNPELAVAPIIDAVAEAPADGAPVMVFPLPHAPDSMSLLEIAGIPNFRNLETCAETVSLILRPAATSRQPVAPLTSELKDRLACLPVGVQPEAISGEIFAMLGIERPKFLVLGDEQALPEKLSIGYPLVAKLISADLPHKSDAGAVRININTRADLEAAITEMQASAERHTPGYRREGILIQEMRPGLGEAIVGLTRDPLVGPVITVGMGGILTEIYRDISVRRAPVDTDEARKMIAEVKGFAALNGFRGKTLGDLDALALCVSGLSRLALSPRVEEAEINPVAIMKEGKGVLLLDALIKMVAPKVNEGD